MLKRKLLEEYGVTMTAAQVAKVIHQHPAHVRNLCRNGQLPAVQIGTRWRVNTEKLAAILDGTNE